MSTVISKQITFKADSSTYASYTNWSTYQGTVDSEVDVNYYISMIDDYVMLRVSGTTTEYGATLNSTAMSILYPNAVAHPIKGDIYYDIVSGYYFSQTAYGYSYFDGTDIFNWSYSPGLFSYETTKSTSDLTSTALLNSTRNSTIRFGLKSKKTGGGASSCIKGGYITLYFNQYNLSAASGTGISSVTVSSSTGFDGDIVNYTCSITSGYIFDGWYNGSTKISSSQNYSYTVNGTDITLTAVAVLPATNYTPYYKEDNAWKQGVSLYQKVNGNWNLLTDPPTGYSKLRRQHNPWTFDKCLTSSIDLSDASNILVSSYIPITTDTAVTVQCTVYGSSNILWDDYSAVGTYHDYWTSSGGTLITEIDGYKVYSRTLEASKVSANYVRVQSYIGALTYCKVWQNDVLLFDGSAWPIN